MGKTKIKTINDAAPTEEPKKKPVKKQVFDSEGKALKAQTQREDALVAKLREELGITEEEITKEKQAKVKERAAKSEADKVVGAVERTRTVDESRPEPGAKPAHSERRGDVSGTLRPDEQRPKTTKPVSPKKQHSKKYQQALAKIDKSQAYSIPEAVKLAKDASYSQFGGSLEVHINTNQKNIRGLINLPHLSGKKLTILAFGPLSLKASEGQVRELRELGVIIGDDKTLEDIEKGKINFDTLVTTPGWMPKIAKLAKVLGPKGLMPNPKNNTVTDDLKKTIAELQSGKVEYKTETHVPIIHLGVGKLNQDNQELEQNIKVLLSTIGKSKITKAVLSPTMGPSVKLDLSSIFSASSKLV